MTDEITEGAALFSPDGLYRYELRRIWDPARILVLFVMLNPSTANAQHDDPTIRRCLGFAREWGYGGLLVGNLFGLRATDPRMLQESADPVGPDNDFHLDALMAKADLAVMAWGARGDLKRVEVVKGLLRRHRMAACSLGTTKAGQPRHPLYVPKDVTIEGWK